MSTSASTGAPCGWPAVPCSRWPAAGGRGDRRRARGDPRQRRRGGPAPGHRPRHGRAGGGGPRPRPGRRPALRHRGADHRSDPADPGQPRREPARQSFPGGAACDGRRRVDGGDSGRTRHGGRRAGRLRPAVGADRPDPPAPVGAASTRPPRPGQRHRFRHDGHDDDHRRRRGRDPSLRRHRPGPSPVPRAGLEGASEPGPRTGAVPRRSVAGLRREDRTVALWDLTDPDAPRRGCSARPPTTPGRCRA